MEKKKIQKDDLIMGFMVKVCAWRKESEKALKIWWEMIELPEIRLHCLHYNALIKALSVRYSYC